MGRDIGKEVTRCILSADVGLLSLIIESDEFAQFKWNTVDSPLNLSIRKNRITMFRMLLNAFLSRREHMQGHINLALIVAVQNNRIAFVDDLIIHANTGFNDEWPLRICMERGFLECAEHLFEKSDVHRAAERMRKSGRTEMACKLIAIHEKRKLFAKSEMGDNEGRQSEAL